MNRPSLSSVGDVAMTAIVHIVAAIICIPMLVLRALGWFCNPAGFWAMTRLDSAGRARIRLAQESPAPLPLSEALAPDSRLQAGAP